VQKNKTTQKDQYLQNNTLFKKTGPNSTQRRPTTKDQTSTHSTRKKGHATGARLTYKGVGGGSQFHRGSVGCKNHLEAFSENGGGWKKERVAMKTLPSAVVLEESGGNC